MGSITSHYGWIWKVRAKVNGVWSEWSETRTFDVALIVSGDQDIVPAIEVVRDRFPHKRVVAVFPPMRSCDDLRHCSNAYYHITEKELKQSLFPQEVRIEKDIVIKCPEEWC